MIMEGNNPKDTRRIEIERFFESSRLAGELMACAYENLIPIPRRSLNPTPQWKSSHRLCGQISKEKRQCLIGI